MSFYGSTNVSGMVAETRVKNYVDGNPLIEEWKKDRIKRWEKSCIKEDDAHRVRALKFLFKKMADYCCKGLDDSMIDPVTKTLYPEIFDIYCMKENAFNDGWNTHCDFE